MSPSNPDDESPATELRRAFDASFAQAPAPRTDDAEPFLLLELGGHPHAVRVGQIRGFAAARKIVPLSSPIPELLGLAGFRGSLVPVYDMAALLGYGRREMRPRWFILVGEPEAVAFAISEFQGYVEQPGTGATEGAAGEPRSGREVLVRDGVARVIVDVAAVLAIVRSKAGLGTAASSPPHPGGPEPNSRPREP